MSSAWTSGEDEQCEENDTEAYFCCKIRVHPEDVSLVQLFPFDHFEELFGWFWSEQSEHLGSGTGADVVLAVFVLEDDALVAVLQRLAFDDLCFRTGVRVVGPDVEAILAVGVDSVDGGRGLSDDTIVSTGDTGLELGRCLGIGIANENGGQCDDAQSAEDDAVVHVRALLVLLIL